MEAVNSDLTVADRAGERLAAAWMDGGKVRLALYALAGDGSGSNAESDLSPVRTFSLDLECPDLYVSPRIRFSPGGGIVSLECLIPSDPRKAGAGRDQWVEWHHAILGTEELDSSVQAALAFLEATTKELVDRRTPPAEKMTCTLQAAGVSRKEGIRLDKVDSVYFGARGASGKVDAFVTTGPDGYVRLWRDPPEVSLEGNYFRSRGRCPRAQFFSDFVRISLAGRPSSVAFQETAHGNYYAVYHDDPPVIRVFEQRDPRHAEVIMEHYPAAGLGTIVDMRFTQDAKCIGVRMARPRPLTRRTSLPDVQLDYTLILDKGILMNVGRGLLHDLPNVHLGGDPAADRPYARLPAYSAAIKACDSASAARTASR
jgi:hypothetical protein